MIGITGQRTKTKVFVEAARIVVFGVNGERANACDVRSLQRSFDSILQQASTEAFALPRGRNR